jgi:hypothetical protein
LPLPEHYNVRTRAEHVSAGTYCNVSHCPKTPLNYAL